MQNNINILIDSSDDGNSTTVLTIKTNIPVVYNKTFFFSRILDKYDTINFPFY